jgi:hypothetical protein
MATVGPITTRSLSKPTGSFGHTRANGGFLENTPLGTTFDRASGGVPPLPPATPAEAAFTVLLARLGELYAAERDVVGLPDGDPAFDAWLSEAELAREAAKAAAEAVILVWTETPADLRFRGVALNFEALLLTDDAGRYNRLALGLLRERLFWTVPGPGPRAERARALLRAFRKQFLRLLTLPDYAPDHVPATLPAEFAAPQPFDA